MSQQTKIQVTMELEEQHHTSSKNSGSKDPDGFPTRKIDQSNQQSRDRRSKNREEEERRNSADGGQHPGNPKELGRKSSE